MAFNVALEDEKGKRISIVIEPIGVPIARAVSKAVDHQLPWASTIDPYGNTIFNYIQAELFRKEWAVVIQETEDDKTKQVLLQVDELLQRCISERLYVKFIGD